MEKPQGLDLPERVRHNIAAAVAARACRRG